MRNPDEVLNSLKSKALVKDYKYQRLYRNFYNPNFYLLAYQHIYNNKGSMTKGIDGMTLNGMGMERILNIIEKMKTGTYTPTPVKRVYIPKKNGKKRPLGIPSADDKLIQEVLRMLLESIYEPTFSNLSHGFRPNRSCHTALQQIQRTYTGVKWFVEGDIKGCFDNIDHHILVGILRKKINDEQIIALIWKFLKAGYIDQWEYHNTYSGAAQGSIISPILANIYMNELDTFMENEIKQFNRGLKREINAEYNRKKACWNRFKKVTENRWENLNEADRIVRMEEAEKLRQDWINLEPKNPMDDNYRRLLYCRYADDFIIGVIGSKEDAYSIKEKVGLFLKNNLNLELSQEKTLVTHAKDKARFLGFDITTSKRSKDFTRRGRGSSRTNSGIIKLYVPKDKWTASLLDKGILCIETDENGKERWMPIARSNLIFKEPTEIINTFNSEIRGLYNYYAPASNVSVLNKYYYVMEYSMYKTLARKYRTSMISIKKKYTKNKIFSIPYTTPSGIVKHIEFYHDGFCKKEFSKLVDIDVTPNHTKFVHRESGLINRMLKGVCELCERKCDDTYVYQVSALADLHACKEWEARMLKMRRKTLVLCKECFEKTKTDMQMESRIH